MTTPHFHRDPAYYSVESLAILIAFLAFIFGTVKCSAAPGDTTWITLNGEYVVVVPIEYKGPVLETFLKGEISPEVMAQSHASEKPIKVASANRIGESSYSKILPGFRLFPKEIPQRKVQYLLKGTLMEPVMEDVGPVRPQWPIIIGSGMGFLICLLIFLLEKNSVIPLIRNKSITIISIILFLIFVVVIERVKEGVGYTILSLFVWMVIGAMIGAIGRPFLVRGKMLSQ